MILIMKNPTKKKVSSISKREIEKVYSFHIILLGGKGKDEPTLAVEEVKKENTHHDKVEEGNQSYIIIGRGAKGVSD